MKKIRLILLLSIAIFFAQCHHVAVKPEVETKKSCVAIFGDVQDGFDVHKEIVTGIMKFQPAAVFHCGDMVDDGWNKEHWNSFNTRMIELYKHTRFYPAMGNHEANSTLFFENFELPNNERWYSVDIDNMHCIVLDTNWTIIKNSQQYKWLEQDLVESSKKPVFKVAIFHHPPFSSGKHAEDEKHLRDSIVPLFEQYKVDIVFNGHDHVYERLSRNGVYYIVSGGGGAQLYSKARNLAESQLFLIKHHFSILTPQPDRLSVKVYDEKSNLIDSFDIAKQKR